MKNLLIIFIIFLSLPLCAEPYKIPAGLTGKAAEMFPGASAPHGLRYRSDIGMPRLGFNLVNYDFTSGGKVVGGLTRLIAVSGPEMDIPLDILVKFDGNGKITDIRTFYASEADKKLIEGKMPDINLLLGFYINKMPMDYQLFSVVLANGLATAQQMRKAEAPPAPPAGFTADFSGKILIQGAELGSVAMKSIDGRNFSTKGFKDPLILLFTNTRCTDCQKMIDAAQKAYKASGKKNLKIIYIVSAESAEAAEYAKAAKISKEFVVADSMDAVVNLFQVPFKPYSLMYDNGLLKSNVVWEDEEKYLGHVFQLLGLMN